MIILVGTEKAFISFKSIHDEKHSEPGLKENILNLIKPSNKKHLS